MSAITNLLLSELRAIELSPLILQTRLRSWEYDLTLDELVEGGYATCTTMAWSTGPEYLASTIFLSRLTPRRRTQARAIGGQLGVWRRVA